MIFIFSGLQASFRKVISGKFNPEEPMVPLIGLWHYFEISTPVEMSTGSILAEPINKNFQKIDFSKLFKILFIKVRMVIFGAKRF